MRGISISSSARKFMDTRGITDVTFNLKVFTSAGCCGVVMEIEPDYKAVEDATGYRYYHVEGKHVFLSREIKIIGPITLTTEGVWKMQRLALDGVSIPI